jgi:hypothetical protein
MMKTVLKHLIALSISVVIAAPIFAVSGAYAEIAAGRIPWIAGSIFMSAIWSVFLSILASAPVATVSVYIAEHRHWMTWPLEPLILLGVTSLYCRPVALLAFGRSLPLAVAAVLSLYFPALIYVLILRAMSLTDESIPPAENRKAKAN